MHYANSDISFRPTNAVIAYFNRNSSALPSIGVNFFVRASWLQDWQLIAPLPQIILNNLKWLNEKRDVKGEKIKMYFNPNYRSQEKEKWTKCIFDSKSGVKFYSNMTNSDPFTITNKYPY